MITSGLHTIRLYFDFDENLYFVVSEGLKIEGKGETERKAISDFIQKYQEFKLLNE